jgi:arabinose-5-phosphate isomerase
MRWSRDAIRRDPAGDAPTLRIAKRVLEVEAEAILAQRDCLDHAFSEAVGLIHECEGKIIVSGIGKSGHVGRKIASTLSSTGTPSFFVHPSEGIHGDLGTASRRDIFLVISNSGETEEILRILSFVRRLGCPIIAITGRRDSTLARNSDVVIPVQVREEACPLGLAPTASSTATIAMGDALAVALLELRGFTHKDFARLHPGGTLGRRLLLTVADLMHTGEAIPLVHEETFMKDALLEITSKALGVTGVVNGEGDLVGVITDGDLRRGLERGGDILNERAQALMTCHPKWIHGEALAVDALNQMQRYAITSLFVFDSPDRESLSGIIHIHDLLRAAVV